MYLIVWKLMFQDIAGKYTVAIIFEIDLLGLSISMTKSPQKTKK